MSLADLLPARLRSASRLPGQIGDLRGPAGGVLMLPRNLSWPGLRECDVADDASRRAMYAILLTQGSRRDIGRLVNAGLLSRDWPLIRDALSPRVSRWCERRLGLPPAGRPASQEARS